MYLLNHSAVRAVSYLKGVSQVFDLWGTTAGVRKISKIDDWLNLTSATCRTCVVQNWGVVVDHFLFEIFRVI